MKKAIFTYGRFNPPTIGHKWMIERLVRKARREGADPFIVVTHSQDSKKNPLSSSEKKYIIERAFPKVPILATSRKEPNPLYIIKKLKNMGYNNYEMVVGGNRLHSYNFVGVPVSSGGVRGEKSASATRLRNAIVRQNNRMTRRLLMTPLINVNVFKKTVRSRLKKKSPKTKKSKRSTVR